jgi:hypothetical protein
LLVTSVVAFSGWFSTPKKNGRADEAAREKPPGQGAPKAPKYYAVDVDALGLAADLLEVPGSSYDTPVCGNLMSVCTDGREFAERSPIQGGAGFTIF